MNKIVRASAKNCEICSKEVHSYQIRPAKIGSVVKEVCQNCHMETTAYKQFVESAKILNELFRAGQLNNDPQVSGPSIIIEPIDSNIQAAVELLKRMDGNYFAGISKIVAGSEANYGHTSSEDPTILHINLNRITNETKGSNSKRDIVIALATTVGHEAAHSKSFDGKIFVGGEGIAEAEENKIRNWIKANENRLQDLFK